MQPVESNTTVERAHKIINEILNHLDNENCTHCKELLKRVYE